MRSSSLRFHRLPSLAISVATTWLAACAQTLPSPPTTASHRFTPASIGRGQTAVSGGVGGGGAVFGPSVVYADVTARHGATERLDVGGRLTGAVLLGHDFANTPHRGLYTARLFAHHETVKRILAVHGGIGGGGSAAGGFVAADVGLTVGYENPYVVPYLSGQFYASLPVTKNVLDLTQTDPDAPLTLRSPYLGFGPIVAGGVRVPLGARSSPFGSILVELDAVFLMGNDPARSGGVDVPYEIVTGAITYEHRIGARRRPSKSPPSQP